MAIIYLPVKEINKANNINLEKKYILKYELQNVINFLEQIKSLYQDKYFSEEYSYYKIDPQIYNILNNMLNYNYLDLREIYLYYKINFTGRLNNLYTYYEKNSMLSNLNNDDSILESVHLSDLEKISNELYFLKLQDMFRNLTINEKNMKEQEFKEIINNFFDLFDCNEIKGKNRQINDIDSGIAYFNAKILKNYPFEKVYKKMC